MKNVMHGLQGQFSEEKHPKRYWFLFFFTPYLMIVAMVAACYGFLNEDATVLSIAIILVIVGTLLLYLEEQGA
ncbi:hypothetical protein D4R86_04875 [bacterium]|nr:MAG: hypothetical protein D4R86_04875 [bacterium]